MFVRRDLRERRVSRSAGVTARSRPIRVGTRLGLAPGLASRLAQPETHRIDDEGQEQRHGHGRADVAPSARHRRALYRAASWFDKRGRGVAPTSTIRRESNEKRYAASARTQKHPSPHGSWDEPFRVATIVQTDNSLGKENARPPVRLVRRQVTLPQPVAHSATERIELGMCVRAELVSRWNRGIERFVGSLLMRHCALHSAATSNLVAKLALDR